MVSFYIHQRKQRSISFHNYKNMAPAVNLGHAATALSLLALGLNVETRFRVGEVLAAEPEPTLGQLPLEDRLGELEGTVAGHHTSLAHLGVRTARCEALLEPLEEGKPGQSSPDASRATNRSIDTNTT